MKTSVGLHVNSLSRWEFIGGKQWEITKEDVKFKQSSTPVSLPDKSWRGQFGGIPAGYKNPPPTPAAIPFNPAFGQGQSGEVTSGQGIVLRRSQVAGVCGTGCAQGSSRRSKSD